MSELSPLTELAAIHEKILAILLQHDTRLVAAVLAGRAAMTYGTLVKAGMLTQDEALKLMQDLVTFTREQCQSDAPAPPIIMQDFKGTT